MDSEIQKYAIQISEEIYPQILEIIEKFSNDDISGFKSFLALVPLIKVSFTKIIGSYHHPASVGQISPRLLRDPLDMMEKEDHLSLEEKRSHFFGYLKAIILLLAVSSYGLEPWEFRDSPIYEKSLEIASIDDLPAFIQSLLDEIPKIGIKTQSVYSNSQQLNEFSINWIEEEKATSEDEKTEIPFTARLTAHHRAIETKSQFPLIIDPFAEKLAGNLESYIKNHKFSSQRSDYAIVRTHYIEEVLLKSWCQKNKKSQIVLLGAGLDTRVYRFQPLKDNSHTIFEIDLRSIVDYKNEIMKEDKPLCRLVRLSNNLIKDNWINNLLKNKYSKIIPTFWILEGLVYYLEKEQVKKLLNNITNISLADSELFLDVCIPAIADLQFGSFTRYFKWGITLKEAP